VAAVLAARERHSLAMTTKPRPARRSNVEAWMLIAELHHGLTRSIFVAARKQGTHLHVSCSTSTRHISPAA
jgi:hypothetical protein